MKKEVIYTLMAVMLCSIAYAGSASLNITIITTPPNATNCTTSWSCNWDACQPSGIQTPFSCFDSNLCSPPTSSQPTSQSCSYTAPSSGGGSHHSSGGGSSYCSATSCGLNKMCVNGYCVNATTTNRTTTTIKTTTNATPPKKEECPVCETCAVCATCAQPELLDNGLYCNKDEDCKSGYCAVLPFWPYFFHEFTGKHPNKCADKPAESAPMSASKVLFWMGILLLALILAVYLLYRFSDKKSIELTAVQQQIYDYLKDNKEQFRLKDLKNAALHNGYSKEDVKVAMKRLKRDG